MNAALPAPERTSKETKRNEKKRTIKHEEKKQQQQQRHHSLGLARCPPRGICLKSARAILGWFWASNTKRTLVGSAKEEKEIFAFCCFARVVPLSPRLFSPSLSLLPLARRALDHLRRAVDGAVHRRDGPKVDDLDVAAERGVLDDGARGAGVDGDDLGVAQVEHVAAVQLRRGRWKGGGSG